MHFFISCPECRVFVLLFRAVKFFPPTSNCRGAGSARCFIYYFHPFVVTPGDGWPGCRRTRMESSARRDWLDGRRAGRCSTAQARPFGQTCSARCRERSCRAASASRRQPAPRRESRVCGSAIRWRERQTHQRADISPCRSRHQSVSEPTSVRVGADISPCREPGLRRVS